MPDNVVVTGLGCKVSYCATSNGSFTEVAQLQNIGGTNAQVGMWDSTGLASTAGEQVPTLVRNGELPFQVIYNPANATHVAIQNALKNKTLLYWKLTYPSPVGIGATAPNSPIVLSFAGYVQQFGTQGYEVESGVVAPVVVAITGAATLSDGS